MNMPTDAQLSQVSKKATQALLAIAFFALGWFGNHFYQADLFSQLRVSLAQRETELKYEKNKPPVQIQGKTEFLERIEYLPRPIDPITQKPVASDMNLVSPMTEFRVSSNGRPIGVFKKSPTEQYMFQNNWLEIKQSMDFSMNVEVPVQYVDQTKPWVVTVGPALIDNEIKPAMSITHQNRHGFSQNFTGSEKFVYFGLGWALGPENGKVTQKKK